MFVTRRGSVSVSAANLPPGLREAIESAAGGAAGGGLPPGLRIIGAPAELFAPGGPLGGPPDGAAPANAADAPSPGMAAAPDFGSAFGAMVGAPAGAAPGEGGEMNDRIRHLSGAIANTIFRDLLSGAIRAGEPGPPPASEDAISKLERNVTPPEGSHCPICLSGFGDEPESPMGAWAAGGGGSSSSSGSACRTVRMPCGHDFHESCLLQAGSCSAPAHRSSLPPDAPLPNPPSLRLPECPLPRPLPLHRVPASRASST